MKPVLTLTLLYLKNPTICRPETRGLLNMVHKLRSMEGWVTPNILDRACMVGEETIVRSEIRSFAW